MDQSVKKIEYTQELNDFILSAEQLKELAPNSRLFEVKFQNEIKGIALDKDLKSFFNEAQEDAAEFKFYTVREIYVNQEGELQANQEFISAQKHPYFQRRRPQAHGDLQADTETQMMLVINGHKTGPFTMMELQEKLNDKTIKLSDLVSVDAGHTWGKIYQLKGFDRRDLSAEKLPQGPNAVILNEAQTAAEKHLRYNKSKKGELDAIAGLSYLGQGRHLQSKSIWDEKFSAEEEEEQEPIEKKQAKNQAPAQQKSTLFKIVLLSILFVGLLSTVWEYVSDDNKENETAVVSPIKRKKQENTQDNLPMNNTTPNINKNPTRQAPAVGERKNLPNFKRKNNNQDDIGENIPEENFYYDDGVTPYEQDPVRKKLGRDLTNPRLSPFDGRPKSKFRDDSAEGIFGTGRAPASGSEDGLFEQEAEL